MRKMDDKLFDELLTEAFNEQYKNETAEEPSKAELDKQYPVTPKQLKAVKALSAKKKSRTPLWARYAAKAAVIALCVITAGFGIMMTDPGIRGTVGNAVTNWIDENISIDFTNSEDTDRIDISAAEIGYIPRGYELTENNSDRDSISHIYSNDKAEFIIIDICKSSDIELMTENENHEVEILSINGYEGYISYSDELKQGSVYFGNKYFTVAVSAMTERDELIKIAENIEIKE